MEGEEEEVEMAGDRLFSPAVSMVGPSTPSSLLAVSACSRCSGRSITSCPGGCSTMMLVSETPAPHREQDAWRGEVNTTVTTKSSGDVVGSGPEAAHFATPRAFVKT